MAGARAAIEYLKEAHRVPVLPGIVFPGLVAMLVLVAMGAAAGEIHRDEEVVFFPTSAWQEDGAWRIPVHGWIFEPEPDSLWRAGFVASLRRLSGVDDDPLREARFRQRVRFFLVDNERGKMLRLELAGRQYLTEASAPNGHFRAQLHLPVAATTAAPAWLPFATHADGERDFHGKVQLVGRTGLSVISDIDDTVKLSEVLDRRALLANTFVEPFRAVEGMPALYRRWQAHGAAFHYVSSSPWQLYPPLAAFFHEAGLPAGSFHLKTFRLKDGTLFDMFASSLDTKPPVIFELLQRYPDRRFILVGDSGEHDPEVYGLVARRFPRQVVAIYIRAVEGSDLGAARMQAAFHDVPATHWQVFDDPARLAAMPLRQATTH